MAMTLDELRSQLSGLEEYVPEDEATLRQRAVDIYSPQYQSDLSALRDQIAFQTEQQQRQAVKTGMQRSSYNAAQQASIRRGGLQSQAQLSANYEGNIANLLNQLLENEKDRKQNADQYRNNLLLQLYDLENAGSKGSGSGSGLSNAKKTASAYGLLGVSTGINSLLNGLTNRVTTAGTNGVNAGGSATNPGNFMTTYQKLSDYANANLPDDFMLKAAYRHGTGLDYTTSDADATASANKKYPNTVTLPNGNKRRY